MSIKERQRAIATEQILQEYLTSGRYPEAAEIQQRIHERFKERSAGLPRFHPTSIEQDSISNPEQYNNEMKAIHEDLQTSFYEMNYQSARLLSIVNSYETEKRKLQLSLRKLEEQINIVRNKYSTVNSGIVLSDTLHTFNQIDFKGNPSRGIPKTNTLVDLRYGQVMLENVNVGGVKYDISKSESIVQITKGSGEGTEYTPVHHIFKDTLNESWEYRVTSDNSGFLEITMVVKLPEIVEATSVSLELHSPKSTQVALEVADDNEIFREVTVQEGTNAIEWKLDSNIKYLRFRLSKNEPDFSHETQYEYQFGATNLSIKRESFLPSGYFVSQPYIINEQVVNKLKLSIKDVQFTKTNIRYYIGVDTGKEILEWQEVEPNKTVELYKLSDKSAVITSSSTAYGVKTDENFGVDYYSLIETPERPEEKSSVLHMGNYMWKVDTVASSEPAGYIPSLSDWINPKDVTTTFFPVENTYGTEHMTTPAATLQRVTLHLYCNEAAQVLNNILNINQTASKAQVYVNNTKLKPIIDNGQIRYNYRFQKGWNSIQVVLHNATAGTFQANLYLKDIASRIFAIKEPLTEVRLYDLYNNVSKKDFTKYAINGNRIVVNYNPYLLDGSGKGVKYQLQYRHAPAELPRSTSIRFMAILSRSDSNDKVSPILKNYQIIIE